MWGVYTPGGGNDPPRPDRGRFGAPQGPVWAPQGPVWAPQGPVWAPQGRVWQKSPGEAGKPFFVFCFSQAGNKTRRSLKPTHSSLLGRASRAPARRCRSAQKAGRSPHPLCTHFAERKEAYETEKRPHLHRTLHGRTVPPHPGAGGQGHDDPQQLHPGSGLAEEASGDFRRESRGERAQRHREQPEPAHHPGPHGPGAGGESGCRPPGLGQALPPLL